MKTKEPIKEVDIWHCETCNSNEMTRTEAMDHIREKHGLTGKIKGSRKMMFHLDCSDSFSSTWEITVVGKDGKKIKLTNATVNERHKDDPMRHE